jgi:hypothetical protein
MGPDQLAELAKQGLLGFFLVLTLGAVLYLYKALQRLQAARMADWKEIADTIKANSVVMRDWIAANESRTRAIEANARTQELAAAALNSLVNELAQIRETVYERTGEALKSNREVREAVLKIGGQL